MNETVCEIKGTDDGNWRGICVLAVGDLYQLPPLASPPIYMLPHNVQSLNDLAVNQWEKCNSMSYHKLCT